MPPMARNMFYFEWDWIMEPSPTDMTVQTESESSILNQTQFKTGMFLQAGMCDILSKNTSVPVDLNDLNMVFVSHGTRDGIMPYTELRWVVTSNFRGDTEHWTMFEGEYRITNLSVSPTVSYNFVLKM